MKTFFNSIGGLIISLQSILFIIGNIITWDTTYQVFINLIIVFISVLINVYISTDKGKEILFKQIYKNKK